MTNRPSAAMATAGWKGSVVPELEVTTVLTWNSAVVACPPALNSRALTTGCDPDKSDQAMTELPLASTPTSRLVGSCGKFSPWSPPVVWLTSTLGDTTFTASGAAAGSDNGP